MAKRGMSDFISFTFYGLSSERATRRTVCLEAWQLLEEQLMVTRNDPVAAGRPFTSPERDPNRPDGNPSKRKVGKTRPGILNWQEQVCPRKAVGGSGGMT